MGMMLLGSLLTCALAVQAEQWTPTEADHYTIRTYEPPAGVELEVSGLAVLPDGRPLVCTRRGELWVLDDPEAEDGGLRLLMQGLQEPLGLLLHKGWIYVSQRGELSRLRDVDGDDVIDELETVCDAWRISGNYHEYLFGPRLDHEGNLWLTANKPFGGEPFGRVDWRGFALRVTPEGEMLPTCAGLRSPAGVEVSPWGDVFYTDNQGEWCGASKLAHLEPGDFHGHPWGLDSCQDPAWTYSAPRKDEVPDGVKMPEVDLPTFKLPAVWFPYDKMGRSPSGLVWDRTEGGFGPFEGQVFVGDQYASTVMRVALERVEGHWQGACFPFREGFSCGVLRLAFGRDAEDRDVLYVGETNRGWGSRGDRTFGLQKVRWTGRIPFEVLRMEALPEGFRLVFTRAVDRAAASDPGSYRFESYTYLLHETYGSDEVDRAEPAVVSATVAADGLSVELGVEGLREGYVHELHAEGVRSAGGLALLHDRAYYTLVRRPAR